MGIFERLFGRTKSVGPLPLSDDEAMKIINAYGKAMVDRKSPFGDASDLPYPKARIK